MAQKDALLKEKDGIAALTIRRSNKVSTHRSLVNYEDIIHEAMNQSRESKVISLHTRTATKGGVNWKNVHYFQVGDYFMAHNGWCWGNTFGKRHWDRERKEFVFDEEEGGEGIKQDKITYGKDGKLLLTSGSEDMSDSYNFLLKCRKPITKKSLKYEIDKQNFSGVACIVNELENKLWVFGTREIKIQTDLKTFMFMYSYDPQTISSGKKSFMGFTFPDYKIKNYSLPEGVYEFNYAKI